MSDLSVKEVITSLVEMFFPTSIRASYPVEGPQKGLHFCIEVRGDNYGYGLDGNTHHPSWESSYHRYVHLVVLATRRVYSAVSTKRSLEEVTLGDWVNTSNHISCWRDDGIVVLSTQARCALKVRESTPEGQRLPGDSYVSISLTPMLQQPFRFVEATRGCYFDGYHDSLLSVRAVPHELSFPAPPIEVEGSQHPQHY